jgi:hypothetical protein
MDTKAVPDTRRHPRQARQAPGAQRFGLRVAIFKSEQISNYDIARGRRVYPPFFSPVFQST